MRRRDLLAYVIGAAVAGTALAFPYALRELLRAAIPTLPPVDAPFFLLPIAWGAWNVVWVRCRPRIAAPLFGAILGVVIAGAGNALMAVRGTWGAYMLLLFIWGPALYALSWTFLVVPLNRALDAEP